MTGQDIADAARTLVGARFRTQGRDAATGLDCLGVVVAALSGAGREIAAPRDYHLTADGLLGRLVAALAASGVRAAATPKPGDITLFAHHGRPHLAVRTAKGIVHAHAGLRRVVEGPADPAWTPIAAYRFADED